MASKTEEAPIELNITWVVRALEREYVLQSITAGKAIKVSYAKLLGYCPQEIINSGNCAGWPDFMTISICLELAEEHGLITVERSRSQYSYNYRRSAYRLPPNHPMVRKAQRRTATGNTLLLASVNGNPPV